MNINYKNFNSKLWRKISTFFQISLLSVYFFTTVAVSLFKILLNHMWINQWLQTSGSLTRFSAWTVTVVWKGMCNNSEAVWKQSWMKAVFVWIVAEEKCLIFKYECLCLVLSCPPGSRLWDSHQRLYKLPLL